MDKVINDPANLQSEVQAIVLKARQLLSQAQRNEAWAGEVEASLAAIGNHIEIAQSEVDSHSDPAIRQAATNLIGELISTRLKLERAREASQSKSPSIWAALKHTLGLDAQSKDELVNSSAKESDHTTGS